MSLPALDGLLNLGGYSKNYKRRRFLKLNMFTGSGRQIPTPIQKPTVSGYHQAS